MNFPEIRAFFDLAAANHGIAAQELDAAETSLRLTLPPLLRAYYTENTFQVALEKKLKADDTTGNSRRLKRFDRRS